jgi:hypothetical protein
MAVRVNRSTDLKPLPDHCVTKKSIAQRLVSFQEIFGNVPELLAFVHASSQGNQYDE